MRPLAFAAVLLAAVTSSACYGGSSAPDERPSPAETGTAIAAPASTGTPGITTTPTAAPPSTVAAGSATAPLSPPLPPPVARGDPTRRAVYLTFDDGYGYTDEVLRILQEREVRATACLIGRVIETNPGFVRRWLAAGYTICNHTFWHGDLTLLEEDDLRSEIVVTEAALAKTAPDASLLPFVRPPLGRYNEALHAAATELGYRLLLWSLDPEDWRPEIDAETVRRRVVETARNGDIILLHFQRPATIAALPSIIDGLRERGFEILGLESLLSGS